MWPCPSSGQVWRSESSRSSSCGKISRAAGASAFSQPGTYRQLATLLDTSERVTLFCGAGCADAHDEVMQLAHKLQAPIVHTLRGKEYLEYDNPYDVGMTGLVGSAVAALILQIRRRWG